MRAPQSISNISKMRSRSRKAYISAVPPNTPNSCRKKPTPMRWLATRCNSAAITRRYLPRSGGSIPTSRSQERT